MTAVTNFQKGYIDEYDPDCAKVESRVILLALGRGAMPIRRLFAESPESFTPDEIEVLAKAFEGILKDLELSNRYDPLTMMLARLTMEIAKQGNFTAAQLRSRVVAEMTQKKSLN